MATQTATPTLRANVIGYEEVEFVMDERIIPIVVGWAADGTPQTARALAERELLDPAACDHAGATWSPCLDLRCPRCGAALFLPPRFLAQRNRATLAAMRLLWHAAGWPEFRGGDQPHWLATGAQWTVWAHPLFAEVGGLPVRSDRTEKYLAALLDLAADDE
jgi:hypothetical protein